MVQKYIVGDQAFYYVGHGLVKRYLKLINQSNFWKFIVLIPKEFLNTDNKSSFLFEVCRSTV